jgi:hypothetical protein
LLNSRGAEYVVVGAFALAFHSEPRFTGDLDLLIHRTPDNAKRVIEALKAFGFASLGITIEDLLSEGRVIQLGIRPNRIDLLNFLTGVDTEAVWRKRISGELDGVPVCYIDLESFRLQFIPQRGQNRWASPEAAPYPDDALHIQLKDDVRVGSEQSPQNPGPSDQT